MAAMAIRSSHSLTRNVYGVLVHLMSIERSDMFRIRLVMSGLYVCAWAERQTTTLPPPFPHSCSFVTDVASLALLGDASLLEMSYNRMF